MSEPIYSDPNPFAQNPVRNPDLVEPEPNSGDQMPPDSLLESGFFIDSDQKADAETTTKTNREPDPGKPAAAETTTTTAPEATVPLEATPISQRRPRRPVEESAERPSWLPEGWTVEVRVRTSGATAGTIDRKTPCITNLNHRSFIDFNAFPGEVHITMIREKAVDGDTKSPKPSQVGSLESLGDNCTFNVDEYLYDVNRPMKIGFVVETVATCLLVQKPMKEWPKARNVSDRLVKRPEWLPLDWGFEWITRTAGITAGMVDKVVPSYFFSPSGQKFRSKVEVLHFLETGSMRKRKLKSDADADAKPSESPSDNRKKKSKPNIRNFSDLKFDFRNPPECLTWVQEDDCPDAWAPVAGNTTVPESIKTEWGTVFSRISQLDRSNGAS